MTGIERVAQRVAEQVEAEHRGADGRDLNQLRTAPWTSLFPGIAIGAAVLGFNLLGDALRDVLDQRFAAIDANALPAATPPGVSGAPVIATPLPRPG